MDKNYFASDLLKLFFQSLNNKNIRYAVLRNYEQLPNDNDSKDVDIVVSPSDLKEVVILLKEVGNSKDYQLIWKNELDYLEGFVFVKIDNNDVYSIKLDIFDGFKWRGISYIDHNIILDNTIEYNGFKVPMKAHEAFTMIVYYILYAKKIKTKYLKQIYENTNNNMDDLKKISLKMFSPILSDKIFVFLRKNQISQLSSLRGEMKKELILDSLKSTGVVASFYNHLKTEFFKRNKLGTLIAFSGPDGAGKSTLVDAVMELFHSLGICNSVTPYHLLTENVPSLHKLPGAPKKYAKQDYTKPYQAKTVGFLNSMVRLVYYYLAFRFDRLLYINKELNKNQIVIFDRYFTDIMADPVRIRIGLRKVLVQKVLSLLPQADFTFVVLADKEKILNRKDELKEDKLVELVESYSLLPQIVPKCKVLYNNNSIIEGKLMICKNIFDSLEERYKLL